MTLTDAFEGDSAMSPQQIFEKTMSGVPRKILSRFTINEISFVDRPAQEGALAVIMKSHDSRRSPDSFEKRIDEIAARDKVNKLDAMRRARVEHPEEFETYRRNGIVSSVPSFEKKAKPSAVQDFDSIINEIARREEVGVLEAMRRARRRHPDKFEAYRAA